MNYDTLQNIDGKQISYIDFKGSLETVKKLWDNSHDTRKICKDPEGQYWIVDFHEEMSFSGSDQMYEHFFKAPSLEEAEEFAEKGIMELKRKPTLRPYYASATPSYEIKKVH